jgi:hypothetical protein
LFWQALLMLLTLAFQMLSKLAQALSAGQPAAVEPSPVKNCLEVQVMAPLPPPLPLLPLPVPVPEPPLPLLLLPPQIPLTQEKGSEQSLSVLQVAPAQWPAHEQLPVLPLPVLPLPLLELLPQNEAP